MQVQLAALLKLEAPYTASYLKSVSSTFSQHQTHQETY